MNKAYINEMLATLKKKMFVPEKMHNLPAEAFNGTKSQELLKHTDTNNSRAISNLFNMLMTCYPEKANEFLLLYTEQHENKLADQIIKFLDSVNPQGFSEILLDLIKETNDSHLKSSALTTLFRRNDPQVSHLVSELLYDSNPRMQVSAIIGALYQNNHEWRDRALKVWNQLITSSDAGKRIASLELLEYLYIVPDSNQTLLPKYKTCILSILQSGEEREIIAALNSLLSWPQSQFPEIAVPLTEIYDRANTVTRMLCIKCSSLIYNSDQSLLGKAIEDSNRYIRQEAARVHYEMAGNDAADIFVMFLSTEANGSPRAQNAYLGLLHEILSDKEQFKKIAMSKARLAQYFFLAHEMLRQYEGKKSSALQLVMHILQERIKQYIDLAVFAMQGFEKEDDIYIVRAGLRSRDPRHTANACEVLRNFKNAKLGEILSDLVDQKPLKMRKLGESKFSENVESILSWCNSLPDPWLGVCARKALETMA